MTTYTGQTPYDAEIAKHRDSPYAFVQHTLELWEGKAEGYRLGWADAKTEDDALLEAAKEGLMLIEALLKSRGEPVYRKAVPGRPPVPEMLRAAIAQAEGKE